MNDTPATLLPDTTELTETDLLHPDLPPESTTQASTAPPVACPEEHLQHLQRLGKILQARAAAKPPRSCPDAPAQEPLRRLQEHVRARAVLFYHQTVERGETLVTAAERLHVFPRTLRQWDYECRPEKLERTPPLGLTLLGRPARHATAAERSEVLDFLRHKGGAVGVPRLRTEFPGLARAELDAVLQGYRRELRQQQYTTVRVLHWQVPGRVWAIDYAEPSLLKATCSLPPLDGRYPYLLAVRDLASGCQLAWLPLAEASAAPTQSVLAQLFAEHGAPLVLKMDNGAPFRSDDTKAFLEHAGVFCLFSPPACPGYNGSIEAAIGSLKRRTQEQAVRQGRSGLWTCADAEAARQEANHSHPPRLNGRTPAEVWARRTPIGIGERFGFALTVEEQRDRARPELGIDPDAPLSHWDQGRLDRKAIERALVEHDYLLFTRRRIPQRIMPGKVTSAG